MPELEGRVVREQLLEQLMAISNMALDAIYYQQKYGNLDMFEKVRRIRDRADETIKRWDQYFDNLLKKR